MTGVRTLSIALVDFDEKEARQITALFSRSQHWQQPWQVVTDAEAAHIVLLPADSPAELERWQYWARRLSCIRLIAYAKQAPATARWHLTRHCDNLPLSLFEFATLLRNIATAFYAGELENSQPLPAGDDNVPELPVTPARIVDISPKLIPEEKIMIYNSSIRKNVLQFFKKLFGN